MAMRVVVLLLIICAVSVVGLLAGTRTAAPPTDPFAPYADLMSEDQVLEALRSRRFACEAALSANYLNCSVQLVNHPFSSIHVVLVNRLPAGISFDLNRPALRVGDLIVLWGIPEIVPQKGGVNLLWTEPRVVAGIPTLASNRLDYHAPVYFVTFTLK